MGKTHLIAGAVMLAVAGGQLSAQTVAPKKAKAYMVADAHLDTQWNWDCLLYTSPSPRDA